MIERLDHLNIRTAQLDKMIAWYRDVLGMAPGPRPEFGFAGAWLYAGSDALVHLVAVDERPDDGDDLRLEHGAFRASGFAAFIDRLKQHDERHTVVEVPGFPIVQVNVWDPDDNHLHIDFDKAEVAG